MRRLMFLGIFLSALLLACGVEAPPVGGCGARICGGDGRGGSCGTCRPGFACEFGECVCVPECRGRACGDNGCGGSCGSCQRGFACGAAGTCAIDPNSRWVLTVTSGGIAPTAPSGAAWDTIGGAPDPYVCLDVEGMQRCTPAIADNYAPRWNAAFPAVTASRLLEGFNFSLMDDDVGPDESICAGPVRAHEEYFEFGLGRFDCSPVAFISYTLTPQ